MILLAIDRELGAEAEPGKKRTAGTPLLYQYNNRIDSSGVFA